MVKLILNLCAPLKLWPRWLGLFLFVGLIVGCTGQDTEGAWRGPFPIDDAADCRIRLRNDETFDLACHSGRNWMGTGKYTRDGELLTFNFKGLAADGRLLIPRPKPIPLRLKAGGNSMQMFDPRTDRRFGVWKRVLIH